MKIRRTALPASHLIRLSRFGGLAAALASVWRKWWMPPAEAFFGQRKIGGTDQLAAKLRARGDVGALMELQL